MKNQLSHAAAQYGPQQFKSFAGAMGAFLQKECPQMGGQRTRQVLVQSIQEMVHQFYPQTTHLRSGQVQWTTVHKDEKAYFGKRMQDTQLTSVVLDLVRPEDAAERASGKNLRQIKQEAVVRLFQQAYDQGGCLTSAEMAILLKLSPPTVGKYTRQWEQEHGQLLPRRGSIHDLGPTLTHKKDIIRKLFLEGKTVELVMRETCHSAEAIHRYISNFKQVLLCRQKGLQTSEIAYAVKMSPRLVQEYLTLQDEMAQQNIGFETLLNKPLAQPPTSKLASTNCSPPPATTSNAAEEPKNQPLQTYEVPFI
jgi:hypothetical protein